MALTINLHDKFKMTVSANSTHTKFWTVGRRDNGEPLLFSMFMEAKMVLHMWYLTKTQRKYCPATDPAHRIFGNNEKDVFCQFSDLDVDNSGFTSQLDKVFGFLLAIARLPASENSGEQAIMPILDPRSTPWDSVCSIDWGKYDKDVSPVRTLARKIRNPKDEWEPTYFFPGYTFTAGRDLFMDMDSSVRVGANIGVTIRNDQFVVHFHIVRILERVNYSPIYSLGKPKGALPAWDETQNQIPFEEMWPLDDTVSLPWNHEYYHSDTSDDEWMNEVFAPEKKDEIWDFSLLSTAEAMEI